MKRHFLAAPLHLVLAPVLLLLAPAAGLAENMIPAGSMIQCLVSEGKVSSKTTAIGDPVLCQLSHVEQYGRSTLPWGSYLVGHFEAYKDPGHFVGKGWMELRFDRLVIKPETVIPIQARVVSVPNYNVDKDGKILGKGHPVRDTVEWLIPVLWPIDLINLPRRGPTPVIAPETRLTLKLMDDVGIPDYQQPSHPVLQERPAEDSSYAQQQAAPIERAYAQAPQTVVYQINNAPAQQPVQQPVPTIVNQYAAAQQQPVIVQTPPPQVVYSYPLVRVYGPPVRYSPYGYPPPY